MNSPIKSDPKIEEKEVATVEIREVFKITKVGTVAGCYVTEGKIFRNSKVRIIRDGVVIHTGELASLKRFKDDMKEVAYGYECGLNFNNFNDFRPHCGVAAMRRKQEEDGRDILMEKVSPAIKMVPYVCRSRDLVHNTFRNH